LGNGKKENKGGQEAIPSWKKAFLHLGRKTNQHKRGEISYENFVVIKGLLHRRTLGVQGMCLRLCVPPEQRQGIMEGYHGDK
jgi:hypothetical protein